MGAKPKAHARYAASSSDRWLACPGSVQLSDGAPDQEDSAASIEGTTAHELMEFALNANVKDVVKFFENDEKYPLEMREHVHGFVDWVWKQMRPGWDMLVEERVQLDGVITHDPEPVVKVAFGTVDVALIEPFGVLHVIDFKYGKKHVPHEDNSQMIYYALGLAHKLNYDCETVRLTIYQPRSVTKKSPARTTEITLDELHSWRKKFFDAIKQAEKKDPKLESGEHCFFCPAKIQCPAIYKKSLSKAGLDFADPVQPDPKHLTSDQLRTILKSASYLKLWIKEVETYAEQRLRAGVVIPGFTLEPKRPQRQWKDETHVALEFGDFVTETLMSPAQAEAEMKRLGWDSERIEKFINDNVVAVSSGTKLSQTTNDFDDRGLDDLVID